MKISRIIPFLLLLVCLLQGCAKKEANVFTDIKIGIAPIIQPRQSIQLLAGSLQNPQALASEEEIIEIQELLNTKVKSLKRNIQILDNSQEEAIKANIKPNSRGGMLDYWLAYGEFHGLDLLLIPYLNYYNNKENSHAIVPVNTLVFDFFLIDLRNNVRFLNRYLFSEQEYVKKENSADIVLSSYIKRTKNTKMSDMLKDAIDNTFKEFNLY